MVARERESARAEEEQSRGNQALPIAELPDEFDGEAEDGETYLALARSVTPKPIMASDIEGSVTDEESS